MSRPSIPWLLALSVAASAAASPTEKGSSSERAAIVIQPGSVVRSQVVALGRDLRIEGEALTDVAVVGGEVEVSGSVAGDVIVLGGAAYLAGHARVDGDVFVLGGGIEVSPGAQVGGRSVAYPGVPSVWLVLLEGPSLGVSALSPIVLGAKLALVAAWMLVTVLLLSTSGRQLLNTAQSVRREPFRNLYIGAVATVTLILTVVLCTAFTGALLGVPLLVLVVLAAFLLKLWGTVAVFCAVGSLVLGWIGRPRELALTAATAGVVLFGFVKFLPWVGVWVWTLVTLTGVGAALSSKLGRLEPWFELDALASE